MRTDISFQKENGSKVDFKMWRAWKPKLIVCLVIS